MTRKKQPKYNIGDIVVITLYGTVGKITNINFLFLLDEKYGVIPNAYIKR
ncbi:hypothetical protein [Ectobacillus panaciterrae]|nr:hypothetical protein [Ectobacillus panaciterrae]